MTPEEAQQLAPITHEIHDFGVQLHQSAGTGGASRSGHRHSSPPLTYLDAAMMQSNNLRWGAVAAVEWVFHPISVARKILEEKPSLLVAEGNSYKQE